MLTRLAAPRHRPVRAASPAVLSLPRSCLRWYPKRAHLDRRPTGDGSLAPPRKRIIQISGFQHPKTAYVLLGLQIRPVGDENLTIGLCPQRPRAADGGEAANENPDTGSHHLIVERVDFAGHRFVLCGRVVVVEVVNSNQILCHDFSILL